MSLPRFTITHTHTRLLHLPISSLSVFVQTDRQTDKQTHRLADTQRDISKNNTCLSSTADVQVINSADKSVSTNILHCRLHRGTSYVTGYRNTAAMSILDKCSKFCAVLQFHHICRYSTAVDCVRPIADTDLVLHTPNIMLFCKAYEALP